MTEKAVDFSTLGFLVADDKPFLRNVVQGILLRQRVRSVIHASNGAEAMTVLAANPGIVDCVLCDWNMAPMDGLELLRAIRSGTVANTRQDLRVILLTGHADEQVVKAALAMDANGYVVKPVSAEKLIDAIGKAFASPMSLKPTAAYKSTVTVAPPDALSPQARRIPPHVLLLEMRKRERERENYANKIKNVLREARAPLERGEKSTRPVINRECLDLASIAPGKVLAEDIYAEEGKLLLACGMVLTKTLLERLGDVFEGRTEQVQLMVGDYGD